MTNAWYIDDFSLTDCGQSFDELVEQPSYDKLILIEMHCGYQVNLSSVTLKDGTTYVYKVTWVNPQGNRPYWFEVNGTAYTETSSYADIDSLNSYKWFYDNAAGILYFYAAAAPTTQTLLITSMLYYSNKGVTHDNYYEPLLLSAPFSAITSNEDFWGFAPVSSGTMAFANPQNYWNTIWHTYIWENKLVRVLIGSEKIPYSEFKQVMLGRIKDKSHEKSQVSFVVSDEKEEMQLMIPNEIFTVGDWPDLPSSNIGAFKPLLWGSFTGNRGVPAVCVDPIVTSSGSGTYRSRWVICASSCLPLASINTADCYYWNGSTWVVLSIASSSVSKGEFRTAYYSSTVLNQNTPLRIACVGKSGVDKAPDIVEDIFVYQLLRGDLIESSTMAAAKSYSDVDLALYSRDPKTVGEYVKALAQSGFGLWYQNGEGKFCYRFWEPTFDTANVSLAEQDYWNYKTETKEDKIIQYARIGYNKKWTGENDYSFTPPTAPTTDDANWLYRANQPHTIETLCSDSSGAEIMRQRYDMIYRAPQARVSLNCKWKAARLLPFDKCYLSHAAGPGESGRLSTGIYEVTHLAVDNDDALLVMSDMKGMGVSFGKWTSANAPSWASSTIANKRVSGYWTDSSGYADPADWTSKDQSKWV